MLSITTATFMKSPRFCKTCDLSSHFTLHYWVFSPFDNPLGKEQRAEAKISSFREDSPGYVIQLLYKVNGKNRINWLTLLQTCLTYFHHMHFSRTFLKTSARQFTLGVWISCLTFCASDGLIPAPASWTNR